MTDKANKFQVKFKNDDTVWAGDSAADVVAMMKVSSHDKVEMLADYREAVAKRVKRMYGVTIETASNIAFLRDLETLGEGHVVKLLLIGE